MTFIAIDLGSSYIKSALLDTDTLEISQIQRWRTPEALPDRPSSYYEIDPDRMYAIVADTIERVVRAERKIQGILLSTQMHGFVLCDEAGESVTPFISWRDTRCLERYPGDSGNYIERLAEGIGTDDIRKTGIRLKPGLAACNLFHWIEHHAGLIKENRSLRFCTLGSYLIYRLTGNHACHITNAAATGFVDLTREAWNDRIIEAAGGGFLTFPSIVKEHEACGYYRSEAGDIPVYPDIGDHQASVLGTGVEAENSAVITIGTAGIVSQVTADCTEGDYEIRPYFDSYVLKTVTRLPGGRNLDVLVDFLEEIGRTIYGVNTDRNLIWDAVFQELGKEASDDVAVELGFFAGQLGVQQGRIDGIQAGNLTAGSLFRGAYRNMAHIYAAAIGKLDGASGGIQQVMLSGGVFQRNLYLKEAIENASERAAALSTVKEEALMGLLRIALKIEGKCSTLGN